jgi:hypothetical protein
MNETVKMLMKEYYKEYNAELKYSVYTEKFYVSSNISIVEGSLLTSITEHRNTPEDAIFAFHERIFEAKLNDKEIIRR